MRLAPLTLAVLLVGCGGSDDGTTPPTAASATTASAETQPLETQPVELELTDVATGLDTPWALAWDPEGQLWVTERPGTLRRVGGEARQIEGVVEQGEGGLTGLEIDEDGRFFLMYTAADENRVVRLEDDGSQTVLVDGIPAGSIHDGGRLRLGPEGALFASTGDSGDGALAQDPSSLAGKILRLDPDGGEPGVWSSGRRNVQGLCFGPDGRLFATEHGPDVGDEIDVVERGDDGGWPQQTGNGIHSYTPTIAPAGCAFYDADLIPQWRGSLLFVTLKDESLRRLELDGTGVVDEEVLYEGELGRLRDVRVGPDGAVYLATSNRDGRGSPSEGDDRIVRIAPAGG